MAYQPQPQGEAQGGTEKWWRKNRPGRMKNGVVALSAAAIVGVYAAGYVASAGAEVNTSMATLGTAGAGTANVASASSADSDDAPVVIATPTATATAALRTVPGAVSTPTTAAAPATGSSGTTAAVSYKNGTYAGTGTGPHGDMDVQVVIQGGKIVSVEVTRCGTRYPCSRISELPARVVAAQSASITYVSRATDSSVAFARAVAAALALAKA